MAWDKFHFCPRISQGSVGRSWQRCCPNHFSTFSRWGNFLRNNRKCSVPYETKGIWDQLLVSDLKPRFAQNNRRESSKAPLTECSAQQLALDERDTRKVSHIIFDLEGVVIDSHNYDVEAHERYLSKFRRTFKPRVKNNVLGLPHEDAAKKIIPALDLTMSPETYTHGIWQYQRDLYGLSKPAVGITKLLCHCKKWNIPVALVSGYNAKSFRLKTVRRDTKEILEMFCHIVLGDDPKVKRPKPHPDIYIQTAKRFRFWPKEMYKYLVVTDTKIGLTAAKNAGMQVLLYPTKGLEDETKKEANSVTYNLEHWDPNQFELPRYSD